MSIYVRNMHGMDVATIAEYGTLLPTTKDGISGNGRTIIEHNAHIRAARLARLVAYFAGAQDNADAAEGAEHDAALMNARNALASAEGSVSEMEHDARMAPDDDRAATLARDARSNARPFPMGDVEDARTALARALGIETSAPVAPVGAPLTVLRAADRAASAQMAPHTCEAPQMAGETWRAYGQRTKGCQGCADRRAHATYGVLPALVPSDTVPAAWEGMQGDRVASRGRSPAVASNGQGARRMGPGTK